MKKIDYSVWGESEMVSELERLSGIIKTLKDILKDYNENNASLEQTLLEINNTI